MKNLLNKTNIEDMIYEIRGKQVMLDSDLAKLYQCKNGTKSINLAVNRHLDRFPNDFYFQLNKEEIISCSKFQNETLNINNDKRGTNIKKLPYAFTEQGVAMLATIIRTDVAAEMSISIMRAFVSMKKYISTNLLEQKYINNQVMKNTEDIKLLQESFSKFEEKKIINEIYFNGQIYDAYSKLVNIMKCAKREIIIIDGYADISVLDMTSKINVPVTLIVKNKCLFTPLDLKKYNDQYSNITVIKNDTFHDRYIIIDKTVFYHCGTSINHAGSKTFSINLLDDEFVKTSLLNYINTILKNNKK